MAHALVSAVGKQLASIVAGELSDELKLLEGVENEIGKLKEDFKAIEEVLDDAEKKSVRDDDVRSWVDQLKDVCYEMEDVLDDWTTEAVREEQHQPVNCASWLKEKVIPWISSHLPCISSHLPWIRRPVWTHNIAVRIKDINRRVDEIVERKNKFDFKVNTGTTATELERPKTTSFDDDVSEFCGRDHVKEDLIGRLLSESSQEEHNLTITAIVGMGGIGKTTLAQQAYHDGDVERHFKEHFTDKKKEHFKDRRIWVCVSHPFNIIHIARAILEGLDIKDRDRTEPQSMLQVISKALEGQRFLLVLDDVWNEESKKWEPLRNCLRNGARGSKILVTTRSERVADIMEAADPIRLEELSNKECWSIFSRIAFFKRSEEECEYLKEIGWKIMERCKGLPLAAKVLGGLMRFKKRMEWQSVLDSDLWKQGGADKELDSIFMLSYYDLPSEIKCCFTYCAIFPEDHLIDRDRLIQLWMANGFLEGGEMEITGEEYIESLASRSLFQDLRRDDYSGRIKRCKMHDLVREFALRVSRNECGAIEVYIDEEELKMKKEPAYAKRRHARLTFPGDHSPLALSQFRVKGLRTLMSPTVLKAPDGVMKMLGGLICGLTSLRALDMTWTDIKELPVEIGKLMHLRYLGFEWNEHLEALPETVCDLCNLQTLKLSYCDQIERLPRGIGKLLNLRHLEFVERVIRKLPKGIGELTSLRTLQGYVFICPYNKKKGDDNEEYFGIGDFEKLNCLGGRLILQDLGDLELSDVGEAKRARLKSKKNLRRLYLDFDGSSRSEEAEEEEEEEDEERAKRHLLIAEALEPPPYLEELRFYHYRGAELPSWITLLSGLKFLSLCRCPNLKELPRDFFETLPPLLHKVQIRQCPALRKSCQKRVMENNALYCKFSLITFSEFSLIWKW